MDRNYDGSVNAEYANISGNRKETFNIRRNRNYGFRMAQGPLSDPVCSECNLPIMGAILVINGKKYHYNHFPKD